MDNNDDLKDAINELKESIDSLTTAERDRQNMDNSTDDISSLRGKMEEVMQSNEELRKSILSLTAAITKLEATFWKQ
jgi:uncharacterized coiled-coil DUF342 family protein